MSPETLPAAINLQAAEEGSRFALPSGPSWGFLSLCVHPASDTHCPPSSVLDPWETQGEEQGPQRRTAEGADARQVLARSPWEGEAWPASPGS